MNKTIWFLWLQGFEAMPEICKMCYNSWKDKNPGWKVIFLDELNLDQYVDSEKIRMFQKIKPMQCYTDALRLDLVYNHGGLWVDATQFCNKPLDSWLGENLIENSFVQWDFDSNLPSINFLYSNKCKNDYFKIDINISKLGKGYSKINKLFKNNLIHLKNTFLKKQEQTIGKSSNNTNPKMGVKAIANSFKLMNEPVDNSFIKLAKNTPYFKLSWKYGDKYKDIDLLFKENSKLKFILK